MHGPQRILVFLISLAGALPGSASVPSGGEFQGVSRVVVVGDIHGSLPQLERLLQGTGLTDEAGHWVGGTDQLVLDGDLVDRGPASRGVLDLARRLQEEAPATGGRVHVLLGNHEAMNLLQDYRYVTPADYAAFAAEETDEEREAAWRAYRAAAADGDEEKLAAAFSRAYPSGFFARRRAFLPDGTYGGWLLKLPVALRIDGTAFVHGGLTEEVAALGIEGITHAVHQALDTFLAARRRLEAAGWLTPLMDFLDQQRALHAAMADRRERRRLGPLLPDAQTVVSLPDHPLFGPDGPLWYRGNSVESERVERDRLDRVLELLKVDRLVQAHTPTRSDVINSRFNGRLFRVDVGMVFGRRPEALVIEGGEALVYDPASSSLVAPAVEGPTGEQQRAGADSLDDAQVETLLRGAEIHDERPLGRGSTRPILVELRSGTTSVRGLFKYVEEPVVDGDGVADRYQHEVAAYRLDRMLGLDMVPVAVERRIDGRPGSLQLWVEGAVDQTSLDAYAIALPDPPALARERARAAAFDALIGRPPRKPTDFLFLVASSRMLLIDHSEAFPETSAVEEGPPVDRDLAEALGVLDRPSLERTLGDLLTSKQIEALLARRDRLLETRQLLAVDAPPDPGSVSAQPPPQ